MLFPCPRWTRLEDVGDNLNKNVIPLEDEEFADWRNKYTLRPLPLPSLLQSLLLTLWVHDLFKGSQGRRRRNLTDSYFNPNELLNCNHAKVSRSENNAPTIIPFQCNLWNAFSWRSGENFLPAVKALYCHCSDPTLIAITSVNYILKLSFFPPPLHQSTQQLPTSGNKTSLFIRIRFFGHRQL